jgi:cytosine/adenosine deaminase-related metal-dependent hydrolase
VPGFVNAHCHLELSHLKGLIPENAGMEGFFKEINRFKKENFENAVEIYRKADRKMWYNGIVAVGDISNTTATIQVKINSKIKYHTFVESFGFHPNRAEKSFSIAAKVKSEFSQANLASSIVPHSAYSVSELLFKRIAENAINENNILTIHNQESKAEADFFLDGNGPIAEHFQNNLNIDISHWRPTGKSSLEYLLQFVRVENQLLLIHNTFSGKADIELVKTRRSMGNTFFVLCPLSNLYIENQLPPVELFKDENLNICLGTDSLASNHQLSVLAEMLVLQQNIPEMKLEELIKWACLNGAWALNIDDQLGSFEKGKKPGVNLITGIDFNNMKLTEKSRVKKLG